RFCAEDLSVLFKQKTAYEIFCPSLRPYIPARSTALMWTKTSLPPSSGWMKPKPFWLLNHFTVPLVICVFCFQDEYKWPRASAAGSVSGFGEGRQQGRFRVRGQFVRPKLEPYK